MKYTFLGLLVGGLALLSSAGPAMAARVSVEIEGQTVIQAPTTVDTAASVSKPGGASCAGAVPATALETAVAGDWDGASYVVNRIRAENRPFGPDGSWSFYINGLYSNDTVCTAALKDGDKVLFYWTNAYADHGYDEPVTLDAPATAVPGRPFAVRVSETTTSFDNNGAGTSSVGPSSGATVSGGTAPVTTAADGTAQVTVAGGPYTLVAAKGNRAPARIAGCATTGSDGFCGTTKGSGAPAPAPPATCPTAGTGCGPLRPTLPHGAITAVIEGKTYAKGKGPRQLSGVAQVTGSGVKDVRLRLTRNDRTHCSAYDGKAEKFKAIKTCGAKHGSWFSLGANPRWSYLLPARLGRGRYVLDLEVVSTGGLKSTLARGTTRVVFRVG